MSSIERFSLPGTDPGTLRRNNDWGSTVIFKIAISAGLFSGRTPGRRFRT